MALVNKDRLTLGVTPEVKEWLQEESKRVGLNISVYIEQLVRSEMRKDQNDRTIKG
ncbi:hypothetical protein ABLO26_25410 [Neobacillus sp. 179-J 1A1 HS]|uniref:hypothetical protein n=1 Tax=Neobacillus driksii TaxID=3035913 RepID=UPI0035BBCEC4